MRINKLNILSLLLCTMLSSCIEKFYLDSGGFQSNEIVIEGLLTNDGKPLEIVISRPSQPENPRFNPISGCIVTIENDQKISFTLSESDEAGHYSAQVDPMFARVGACYRLSVKTPTGKTYVSNFEEMMPCPKVDSVYYELKTIQTSTIGDDEDGIQFFIDFRGDPTMGRFFRWSLVETYEYHSTWSIRAFLDEDSKYVFVPEDFSNYVCYKTDPIYDIFTLSTDGFAQNIYNKYPLHFVNNETQRLMYHYSLLIKQYSLSEGAYQFWENIRMNNKENASLYGKQPSPFKSNIHNVGDTTETVLGYFGVSAVSTKRINIRFIEGLTFNKVKYCLNYKKKMRLDSIPTERPLYLYPFIKNDGSIFWVWGDRDCFFCDMHGGTLERPSYWDDK